MYRVEFMLFLFPFLLGLTSPSTEPGAEKIIHRVLVKLFSLAVIQTPKRENAKEQYVEINSGVLAGNSKDLGPGPHSTIHFLLMRGKKLHFSGLQSPQVWII